MSRAPDQEILLDTAAGSPIRNEQGDRVLYPLAAAKLEEDADVLPSRLRARTHPRFNCHGLVFAARRCAILDESDVMRILVEDGYKLVPLNGVLPGDVAVYFTETGRIDHSAVVVTNAGTLGVPFVCSKWGAHGPEAYHLATSCRYEIGDIRYYRVKP